MQATEPQNREQIIETGWHHFSSPRYQPAVGPCLGCWCGASLAYRNATTADIARFVKAHRDCSPNVVFLTQEGIADVHA